MKAVEEWAKTCLSEHFNHVRGQNDLMCLPCARAYARECQEEFIRQLDLRDWAIVDQYGKPIDVAALRALPGETP